MMALLMTSLTVSAQNQISGKVTDSDGEPIPGVSVLIKGTNNGVVTDMDGNYSITVKKGSTLEFICLGFKSVQKTAPSQGTVDVFMDPDAETLDDVVIIGYGVQKKSHFAGAASDISPEKEKLDEIPIDGIDRQLQGRLAGVSIMDTEGQVGVDAQIRIRGNASFSADSSPLIVIDGLPTDGSLNDVNSSDIASIEVLKDAASTAIYGSRGANGVIMVTTKKGSEGKAKFKIKYQAGMTDVLKYYDTYTLEEYAYIYYRNNILYPWETGYLEKGQEIPSGINPDGSFNKAPNGKTYLPYDKYLTTELNPSTKTVYNAYGAGYAQLLKLNEKSYAPDPQKSITKKGFSHKASVSAQGGTKRVKYYVSASYDRTDGVMINNTSETFTMSANMTANMTEKLSVDITMTPRYRKYRVSTGTQLGGALRWLNHPLYLTEETLLATNGKKSTPAGATVGTPAKSRDFRNMWLLTDDFSGYVLDSKGKQITVSTYSGTGDVTSYAIAEDTNDTRTQLIFNGNMGVSYKIIEDLTFRATLGVSANSTGIDFWKGSYTNSKGVSLSGMGTATYTKSTNTKIVNEDYLSYKHKWGDHSFNAMAGFSIEALRYEVLKAQGQKYPNDNIRTLNYAGEIVATGTTNNIEEESLVSMYARAGYDYKGKYIVQATFRRDGSSQFGANKRWGNFPSASAAWRISKEPFMNASKNWLSELKLRASWGISGNNRISRYSYITSVSKVSYVFGSEQTSGYAPSSSTLGSADIGWEETNATNVGISAGFFHNRLNLNIDGYYNKTKALLLKNPILNITGYQNEWMNIGQMENKGMEIELSSVNITKKDFEWTTSAVFNFMGNKLLNYGDTNLQYFNGYQSSQYRLMAGRPVGEYYGYKTTGEIWRTAEEIKKGVEAGQCPATTTVGELKMVDVNGDGIVNENDKTGLGKATPDFEWGLTNTFRYKIIDLSFMFQGSHGGKIWNMTNVYGSNYLKYMQDNVYIDAYHGTTPIASKTTTTECDYLVEDASYVALRSVNIGVTIPKAKLRIYVAGRNLLYWMASGYHGINPEFRANISGNLITGEQRMTVVPLMRSINAGLEFTF